jgi:hypothetical protein
MQREQPDLLVGSIGPFRADNARSETEVDGFAFAGDGVLSSVPVRPLRIMSTKQGGSR